MFTVTTAASSKNIDKCITFLKRNREKIHTHRNVDNHKKVIYAHLTLGSGKTGETDEIDLRIKVVRLDDGNGDLLFANGFVAVSGEKYNFAETPLNENPHQVRLRNFLISWVLN